MVLDALRGRGIGLAIVDGVRGGAIVLTSSVAGLIGFPNLAHSCAARHGLVGLTKVRHTDMIQSPAIYSLFTGGVPDADPAMAAAAMKGMHDLPISWVDPVDISNAVVWLASDEARYVTGIALPVDGGMTAPFKIPHATG